MKDINKLLLAFGAHEYIKQNYASADAKLAYRSNSERLDYERRRNAELDRMASRRADDAYALQSRERQFREEQAEKDRKAAEYEAYEQREHEKDLLKMELRDRERERELERDRIESQNYIAELNSATSDKDRQAAYIMHSQRLEQEARLHALEMNQRERLERDKMTLQQNLADQQERLQIYLQQQGHQNAQEIERFKALASRETQILMARENASNMLQDRLVQESLKTFPLNISPLVLLKNKPDNLTNLLRFAKISRQSNMFLPDVADVYVDVANYSKNPEALNIFIAPLHVNSTISDKDKLTQQIWDMIYQKVETYFTIHYNRRGDHPVIFYPTAWKDNSSAGQHASETLHFFLKDIPCLVIEPRFDGHSLNLMISGWNNGYLSSDHIRVQMNFKVNLYAFIIESVYSRSKKSLELLNKLGERIDDSLKKKKEILEQNIRYYEELGLSAKIAEDNLADVEAIGLYELFDIEPSKDLKEVANNIAELLCLNLSVLADVHHLQSTDATPLLPSKYKQEFPIQYEDMDLRQQVYQCYEGVYISLRSQDASSVELTKRREMERAREMQITNLKKELELINETELLDSMEEKLRKYAEEKYNITGLPLEEMWSKMVEKMEIGDIPFFSELLPNIDDRRLYKRVDKKIADLQRS